MPPLPPPVTSEPPNYALAAGLLQFSFGRFGVGRFYIDSIGVAFRQLALAVFGHFLLGMS